uniref:Protein Wnt n=1 Tax=Ursus maritimus TaxID=29073 RepID=A0A452SZE2_URSMA
MAWEAGRRPDGREQDRAALPALTWEVRGLRRQALCSLLQVRGSGVSLAVGPQYSSLDTQPILCASIPGLVPKQLRFCRNYVEIMPSVAEGIKISIEECQHQFRGRRWNCTTVNNSLAIFGPVLDKATRESAFVHAIASAGVAFAVTRSCAEGSAAICGCSSRHQGSPGEGWKWGGCSEDIEFGGMVSREFADARENRPDARSAMNRHNNEAGRQAIASHLPLKCKCHGLSGSCEVKTCWWSQPDFRAIGDFLKDKYDSASEMVVEKHRESRGWVETLRPRYTYFKVPTERDLVYYEASPNFCEPNPETGSFGTRDRTCNFCLGKGRGAQQQRGLDPEAWLCPGCCVPWPQTPPPQTSPTVAQAPARPGSWLDQQGPLLCN